MSDLTGVEFDDFIKKLRENQKDAEDMEGVSGKYHNYKYKVVKSMGYFCGYVKLSSSHPFAKIYKIDDIPIKTHGGITYSKQKDEYTWIGFDCNHAGDDRIYWTKEMVIYECKKIIDQCRDKE